MRMNLVANCICCIICIFCCIQQATSKGAKVRVSGKRGGGIASGGSRRSGPGSGGASSDGFDPAGSGSFYEGTLSARNASHEERLLSYLFRNYDPVARAVMDTSQTVTVGIQFVLLRIHGLNERSQVLTTTGLIIAEWEDDRLTWDPARFGNLTDIILKAEKIWLPELAVMNGADELIPDFDRIRVLLDYNGKLHWEPGGIFRTTCDIDITYFPFDEQHCPLLIGAYSYYSSKMNITNSSSTISTHDFRLNGEWEVFGTGVNWDVTILECCAGKGYTHVIFTLHIRRRNKFYMMNIVGPCVMLSVLIMIGFFLPPDAGEKISLGISVLLAFTVFLLMIADNIPRTSLAIPLMVIYLTATMTLGTISICLTVLVLNVHHRGPSNPVPRWLKKLVLVYISRLLCLGKTRRRSCAELRSCAADKVYACSATLEHRKTPEGNGILDEMELIGLTTATARTVNSKPINGPPMLNRRRFNVDTPAPAPTSNVNVNVNAASGIVATNVRQTPNPDDDDDDDDDNPSTDQVTLEWRDMAHVLDRLFFWILLILMTVSAVAILLYPQYMGVFPAH